MAARERHDCGAPCRLSPADVEPRRKSAPSRLTGRATTDPRATAPQDHRWPGQRPAGRTHSVRWGQPDCASAGLRPERPGLHAVNRQLNTHLTASPARTDPARKICSATCRQSRESSTSSTGRTGSRLPNLFRLENAKPNIEHESRFTATAALSEMASRRRRVRARPPAGLDRAPTPRDTTASRLCATAGRDSIAGWAGRGGS